MSHKSFVLLRFRKWDQISARSVDKHLYISMNSLVRRISESTFDHFHLLPSNKQPRRGLKLIDLRFPKQCTRSHQSWFSADWPVHCLRRANIRSTIFSLIQSKKNFLISSSCVPKRKYWQKGAAIHEMPRGALCRLQANFITLKLHLLSVWGKFRSGRPEAAFKFL